ncbi:MAG: hypothetical protein KGZ84_06150 [Erysipelotrichia bacterium]|jgi:hypothetical protein|nr:hypothetical protein [Erysipelotrichia bacterium]
MFKKGWLVLLLLLSGCLQQPRDVAFERALTVFESHYFSILDNDRFLNSSNYFNISIEKYELSNQYRYDLIIDNPQVAMYDVVIVIVENNQDFESLSSLTPSLGVFDASVNLVPNQINLSKGFPKGILLSGISTESTIQLRVMVAWKDYYKLKQSREYFILDIDFLRDDEPLDPINPDEEGEGSDE